MADVPRLYVPIYILIRVPLLTLFGAALGMLSRSRRGEPRPCSHRRKKTSSSSR